jgi:hypothetical protein
MLDLSLPIRLMPMRFPPRYLMKTRWWTHDGRRFEVVGERFGRSHPGQHEARNGNCSHDTNPSPERISKRQVVCGLHQ